MKQPKFDHKNWKENINRKLSSSQVNQSDYEKMSSNILRGLSAVVTGAVTASAYILNAITSSESDTDSNGDSENETGCSIGDQGTGHYYQGLRIDDEE